MKQILKDKEGKVLVIREYNGNGIDYKEFNESYDEYDEKGNLIHRTYSDGFEEWHDYDEKGRIVHYKDTKGCEYYCEYLDME